MASPKITIDLTGADAQQGSVLLGDLANFCDQLATCLKRIEDKFSSGTRLKYRITDMRHGSAYLEIQPIAPKRGADFGPAVVQLFSETIAKLESGKQADPRLDVQDLIAFRKMAEPLNGKLKDVRINGTSVTTSFIAHIDRLLAEPISSQGSVTGMLDRINVHNKNEFTLFATIARVPVACTFPDELFVKVREGIKRNVTVYGKVTPRRDSASPERVQVAEIEIHPDDNDLPKLSDLRGSLRGGTEGKSVTEFVRALRDE
jgi:hypothetical protein